jgi:hypothetical protein
MVFSHIFHPDPLKNNFLLLPGGQAVFSLRDGVFGKVPCLSKRALHGEALAALGGPQLKLLILPSLTGP